MPGAQSESDSSAGTKTGKPGSPVQAVEPTGQARELGKRLERQEEVQPSAKLADAKTQTIAEAASQTTDFSTQTSIDPVHQMEPVETTPVFKQEVKFVHSDFNMDVLKAQEMENFLPTKSECERARKQMREMLDKKYASWKA